MKSLLFVKKKKIRSVFIVKKNDFDLSKYNICFVGCKKKKVFDDKNSDLFCYKKEMVF